MSNPTRFERRLLLRRGGRKDEAEFYTDNRGQDYEYKFVANLSSFVNFFGSCLKNGFPVVTNKLWYAAWAFYPFFFIRPSTRDAVYVLNHERIHIRQQREIFLYIGIPLFILSIFVGIPLVLLPFLPTFLYLCDFIRSYVYMVLKMRTFKISGNAIRQFTCFEKEAERHAPNLHYLLYRKPFSNLKFL